ncbi:MAG TPA: hypothetical protein VFZ09_30445 [Archangium sp.]|uniref:nSTAND3 domain-containing NTPase n=1 Tax=Archangium sp. TaxID=1872627 RepID=UPI002E341BCB|nr:hypothetical protein [Archangium sp.]HEX5750587.1 hypothetical protein [Archangium sp.]
MGTRRLGDIECEERMTGAIVAMSGFHYQVRVTVWMALELMFHRRVCDGITVEPVDREDIEAVLRRAANPEGEEHAEARAVVGLSDSRLNVQVKRRAAHWTSGDFTSLMTASIAEPDASTSNRRTPPLVALRDPSTRYLLVTSSQATGEHLPSLRVPEFTAAPIEPRLPVAVEEAARKQGLDPARLAPRIAIMDMCSEELVTRRSKDLLMTHGHVPSTRVDACLDLLERQVWSRLQGTHPGQWRREELEQVICSPESGGRPRSSPELVGFVPPVSFRIAQERLQELHAVFLLGPPGSGKSLTATTLTEELRREGVPFELVLDPSWLEVDERIRLPGRHLFAFEDPWGKYQRREGREGWASDLLERLRRAGPDKKFLLTSAWGLYPGPVTEKEREKLARFQVTLSAEDYPLEARAEIARRRLGAAGTWRAEWLEEHIPELVRRTGNPLVLVEFVDQLAGLETREKANFECLLAGAQHEMLSERLAREVRERGLSFALGALVIWALLTTKGTVTEEAAGHFGRALSGAMDGQEVRAVGVLRWLRDRRSLRERTTGYTVHPLLQKGLELAWKSDDFVDAIEHARADLVEKLIQEEDFGWAVTMLEAFQPSVLVLRPTRQKALDTWLRDGVLEAPTPHAFAQSLYLLRAFSRAADAVKKVTDALLNDQRMPDGLSTLRWVAPRWADEELAQIAKDAAARQLAGRYVEWMLPFTELPLENHERRPEFLRRFGWNLAPEYLRGLDSVLDNAPAGTTGEFQELVLGALLEGAPFEDVLMRCVRALRAHEHEWNKRVPETDWGEQVMDTMAQEHFSEKASEGDGWLQDGLTTAVSWRRRQPEGWRWILTHPEQASLIRPWAMSLLKRGQDMTPDEFDALIELAETHDQDDDVWNQFPWDSTLPTPLVETWLLRLEALPARRLQHLLRKESHSLEPGRFQASFSAALRQASARRRIELVFAMFPFHQGSSEHAALEPIRRLVREATPGAGPIENALQALGAKDEEGLIRATQAFDTEASALLRAVVLSQRHTWAATALLLLARAGAPMREQAQQLLHSPEKEARLRAGLALHADPMARESVKALLKDPHYRCRRLAIAMLADSSSDEERLELLAMHTDKSGPVRQEVAETIDRLGWLDGIPALEALARDTWDQSWYVHEEDGADMPVRSAARQALARLRLGERVEGTEAERWPVGLLSYLGR